MISRRRFLRISAAAAGVGLTSAVAKTSWHGRAFGADVEIILGSEKPNAVAAMDAARDTMHRLEGYFSIYNPRSLLSELNREGHLTMPPEFARLMQSVNHIHAQTDGLFDPTIQPFFASMLNGGGRLNETERHDLQHLLGWRHVSLTDHEISLTRPGMALTLNGIAQGFVTDRVSEVLKAHGFDQTLVNIGEYRVGARSRVLDVTDLPGKRLASLSLKNEAVATSSPDGFTFKNGAGHILAPNGMTLQPVWKTVSVIAKTATMADGISTALVQAPDLKMAKYMVSQNLVSSVLLQDTSDNITRV